jgi:hypothetical protein
VSASRRRLAAGTALVIAGTTVAVLATVLSGGSVPVRVAPTGVSHDAPATPSPSLTPAPEVVLGAPPERMVIPALGFDSVVGVDSTQPGGEVAPVLADRPYWLNAYGVPGTDAQNTVYIAGHSSGDGWAIFDKLLGAGLEPIDLTGQEIRLYTANGALSYWVSGPAVLYPKSQIADAAEVWAVRPGRLVIVTCDWNDRSRNIVFTAELLSAVPAGAD